MRLPWKRDPGIEIPSLIAEMRGLLERIEMGPSADGERERVAAELKQLDTFALGLSAQIADLRLSYEQLRTAVAHGIEHEERRERRIEATVRRAKKQLAELGVEDSGLEAEFDGLSLHDGGAGGDAELSAVREEMEDGAGSPASSVPGVTVEQLQRGRGVF